MIFCAFNSEETISTGESGSFYFNQQMKENYKSVFNINLDCIGNKEGKDLIICSNKSAASVKIAEEVLESYKSSGINAMLGEENVVSDHINFINAISLSTITDIKSSNIHTLEDTPDKIDMECLTSIGCHLGEYVINDLDMENLFRLINEDVIETTDRSENRMITAIGQGTISLDEFEEKFNCELNSIDSSLIYISIPANVYRKKENDHGGSEEKIETENPTDEMTLSDIRIFTFCFENIALSFYTYFKDIPFEMMAYEMDLEIAGYDEKSLASAITIDDRDYFIATESEEDSHSKQMCTIFETDKMFLRVSALFPPPTTDHIKDAEEYKNYFLENVPEGCIDEMVKLLLE
ncbi:MAG TPA: hypothetical protein DIW41_09510 [Lachnospiraceae bacterium]|nr:hypothetical protein [Lachnospiraceae bacterium]